MSWRGSTAALAMLLLGGSGAGAQERVEPRVSAEAVGSLTMMSSYRHLSGVIDTTATVTLGTGLIGIVRPWFFQNPDGTHRFQWWQLQLRYLSQTRTPFRIDAGIITSPIGLNTPQMRADINPAISTVQYYFIPLPRFEGPFNSVKPITAGYPFGVIVSTSGEHWDLRGGMLDSSPTRPRDELKSDQPPITPQVVVGGGVTPRAGLRFGAAIAHGDYRKATPLTAAGAATVANLEAELTVDRTRLSGEWVIDRLDGTTGVQTGHAYYAQLVQTITPRLFGVARTTHVLTPTAVATHTTTTWDTLEVSAGFRVHPSLTARAGFFRQRPYFGQWDNQAAVSVVYAGRWWR